MPTGCGQRFWRNLLTLSAGVLCLCSPQPQAWAGNYSLNLVGSAPRTYNHQTGGGAFNTGTKGVDKDIVESLEGGDFAIHDIVTYMVQIVRTGTGSKETVRLTLDFLAETTGQPGAGFVDVTSVRVNYGVVQNGRGTGGTDSGMVNLAGTSAATLVSKTFSPAGSIPLDPTNPAHDLIAVVNVSDIDPGETIILRVDVRLDGNGQSPSGNLQGSITDATVIESNQTIQVGNQTIPFLHLNNLHLPPLLTIGKIPSNSIIPVGGLVTYAYQITFIGPGVGSVVTNVLVTDDKLGTICTIPAITNGTARSCSATTSLSATTINTALATGFYLGTNIVSLPTVASVQVVTNSLGIFTITKAVSTDGGVNFSDTGTTSDGATVIYRYRLTNTGNLALSNIGVSDDKLGSINTVAALAVGQTVDLTKSVIASSTNSPVINIGTGSGVDSQSNIVAAISNPVTLDVNNVAANLSVVKTASPNPVEAGATLTYTITVLNGGPDAATSVVVSDTLPGGITFLGASPTPTSGPSPVMWTMTNLAASASATLTITARAECAGIGTVVNTVSVNSAVTDPDTSNNSFTQSTTVRDTTPPTITCPPNITVNTSPGQCSATGVNLGTPTANDNCPGVTVSNNAPGSFPLGTTTVTWTARDASGNTATCTQTVTVVDNQPPTITCPPNVTVNTAPGQCSATGVNLGSPTANDNCPGVTVSNNAPASFPLGTTTVTWTARDAASNTATCTQTVNVVESQPPTITCPPNLTVNTSPGQCAATGVNLGTPTANDNCPGVTVSNNAPASFPVGTTTVTWTARDAAGNIATCAQTVTVVDNQPLTITCPPNITVNTTAGQCSATGVNLGTPTANDNCPGVTVSNNAPASFPLGTTTVTWTARDASGNTVSCTQTVTVVDRQPPTITCPPNVTVNPAPGQCSATGLNLGTPTTSDNCAVASVTNNAPGTYPAGTTTVTWTVRDAAGNTATCTQTVTVVENQPPTITCPPNLTVNANPGQCSASGFNLGTPTTHDNCPGVTLSNNAPGSFPVGVTTVTWTARDSSGNTATCTQTVTVVDNQRPTIICPPNLTVNVAPGECTVTSVNLGTPTTNDNCGVASVTNNAPGTYPVGTTTVTWTVTDVHGSTTTCTQRVTIVDNQPPTITCPPDITINTAPGQCTATGLNLGTPATSDNCPGVTVSNNAPASIPTGTTMVTWTARDASGNIATCTQMVTVVENQPPTITCPPDVTVSSDSGKNFATNVALGDPDARDNCPGVTASNDAPAVYPMGITVVTWTARDAMGLTATCTQRVNVQPPVLGVKFYDANYNGVRDDGEPAIAGWKVRLVGMATNGRPVNLTLFTKSNGSYSFTNLVYGNYTLSEEFPRPTRSAKWVGITPVQLALNVNQTTNYAVNFANVTLGPVTVANATPLTISFWRSHDCLSSRRSSGPVLNLSVFQFLNTLPPYAMFTPYPNEPLASTPFNETVNTTAATKQAVAYLRNANKVDMRYMLAAELVATELAVYYAGSAVLKSFSPGLDPQTIISTDGAGGLPAFATVADILQAAIETWQLGPGTTAFAANRARQTAMQALLSRINSNAPIRLLPKPVAFITPY